MLSGTVATSVRWLTGGACKTASKPSVYCWGVMEHGALGFPVPLKERFPATALKPLKLPFAEKHEVVQVRCGYSFSALAVKTKDVIKVYGCGINTDLQIGHPKGGTKVDAPAPIDLHLQCPETNIVSLGTGRAHLVVVTDREGVYTMGSNCHGQCGRPYIKEMPESLGYLHNINSLEGEKVTSVACGVDHTLFLTADGNVFGCGLGREGQTGIGSTDVVSTPTRVVGELNKEEVTKVVACCDTCLALTKSGEVYGWGNSDYGQLSPVGEKAPVICPKKLKNVCDVGKITDIAVGGTFCVALTEKGEVFVWGYGILGCTPEVVATHDPRRVSPILLGCSEFTPDARVIAVEAGPSYIAAINDQASLFVWGYNVGGSLGIGHHRDQFFPFKISLGARVVQVSCGCDHTMVLATPL